MRWVPLLLALLLTGSAWAIPEFPPSSSGGAPATSSYTTTSDETGTLTNARRWVNGSNTTVDLSVPGQIKINSVAGTAAELPTTFLVGAGSAAVGYNFCDATGGSFAALLPSAVGNLGKLVDLKKTDSTLNSVTVTPSGVQTIDGSASYVLSSANQAVSLISDGSNWKVR